MRKKQDADGLRISVELAFAVAGIKRSVLAIDANRCLVLGEKAFITLASTNARTTMALQTQRVFVGGATLLEDLLCKVLVPDALALAALAPESAGFLNEVVRASSLASERTKKAPEDMKDELDELVQMFQKQFHAGESAKACLLTESKGLCVAMTDTIKCYMQGAADMEVSLKGYLKALQDKLHIVRQLSEYTKDDRSHVDFAEHVASACMYSGLVLKWNSKGGEGKVLTMKDVVALSDLELGFVMVGWKEVLKFGRDAARTLLAEACNDGELLNKFFEKVQANFDQAPGLPTTLAP